MSHLPLVLIPGLNCTARLFSQQVELIGRRRPVLVADHARAPTVAEIAGQILAEAPERFALAGLSMGGYIAFEIMRQQPERVVRLALIATSARPDAPERIAIRREQIAKARSGAFREVVDGLYPNLVHPARHEDPMLKSLHVNMAEATGAEGFERQTEAIIARPDSRTDLAAIRVPTKVVVGEQDMITPPELAREIAERVPGASLSVIPHCGHLATLERPETVTRLLATWLDGV